VLLITRKWQKHGKKKNQGQTQFTDTEHRNHDQ